MEDLLKSDDIDVCVAVETVSKGQAQLRKRRGERLAAFAAAQRQAVQTKLEEDRKACLASEDTRCKKEVEATKTAAEAALAEVERKALEDEEALRECVLQRIEAEKVRFRSEPADVLEYAIYLGMQLEEDMHLLWIADEALQAEDPEGWDQCESPNGDVYYVNSVTKEVLWLHPLDYTYQQKYLAAKARNLGPKAEDEPGTSQQSTAGTIGTKSKPAEGTSLAPIGMEQKQPNGPSSAQTEITSSELMAVLQKLLNCKHTDLRSLLVEPSCSMEPTRCYVTRHKSLIYGTKYDFFMHVSAKQDMYCFTGKRESVAKGCYYSIALEQGYSKRCKSDEAFIGKVRSDRKGVEYTVYDDGINPVSKEKGPLRKELLHVNFINSLRNRMPGVMEVIVPDVDEQGNTIAVQPSGKNSVEGLAGKLSQGQLANTMVFKNRMPQVSQESNMYQLGFRGRAALASCKNIQLAPNMGEENDVRFLMGKWNDNTFNIDFATPFSALQAFAFALIVFENSSSY